MPLELGRNSDLSRHIKEPQNGIYCLNFLQNDKIWKLRPCFIPEVTCSVLTVGMLSVSSLLHNVFFTVWEHGVVWEQHGLSDIATVTKEGGFFKDLFFGIFAFVRIWQIRTDRKRSGREIGGRIGKGPRVGIRTSRDACSATARLSAPTGGQLLWRAIACHNAE